MIMPSYSDARNPASDEKLHGRTADGRTITGLIANPRSMTFVIEFAASTPKPLASLAKQMEPILAGIAASPLHAALPSSSSTASYAMSALACLPAFQGAAGCDLEIEAIQIMRTSTKRAIPLATLRVYLGQAAEFESVAEIRGGALLLLTNRQRHRLAFGGLDLPFSSARQFASSNACRYGLRLPDFVRSASGSAIAVTSIACRILVRRFFSNGHRWRARAAGPAC